MLTKKTARGVIRSDYYLNSLGTKSTVDLDTTVKSIMRYNIYYMFKKLKKIKLPFLPKKLTEVPLEDLIVEAEREARDYSLIQDNSDLSELFKNKFKLKNGAQLPPKLFIAKIISYIENNPPQTQKEFAVYVRSLLDSIPPPEIVKKKSRWK